MLLLDRNNEPTSTVYYLSALVFDYLVHHDGMDAATLYQHICSEVVGRKVGYDFFVSEGKYTAEQRDAWLNAHRVDNSVALAVKELLGR